MKKKVWLVVVLITVLLSGCTDKDDAIGIIRHEDAVVNSAICQNNTINSVKNWAYQLQNFEPNPTGFDLIVMDYSRDGTEEGKYLPEEISKIKSAGPIPIAYISIGEAEDYRFYWKDEWFSNPPDWLGKENPDWPGNYAVKYWNDSWKKIVFVYLDRIMEQGFCGVYLDRVDAFEYWSDPNNGEDIHLSEEEAAERMISFIKEVADYCRNKAGNDFYVIPQNGERLIKYDNSILGVISGWAVEDLFYDGFNPLPSSITRERVYYLDIIRNAGKPIFVVDYVDDGSGYTGSNKERIDDFRAKALARGYIPYVARSDRELDELNVIEGVQP